MKRYNHDLVCENPFPDLWLPFWPNILSTSWILWLFWRLQFYKIWAQWTRWMDVLCNAAGNILYSHQDIEQHNFDKKIMSLYSWLVRLRQESGNLFILGSKLEIFNQSLGNFSFFYQHSQPLYNVMQKEIKFLEPLQRVNFEFIVSLKNNDKKCLIISEGACEEIGNPNAYVHIATAGGYRGVNTIYFKRNLFHQSKLEQDVELQNAHIVHFKSLCDMMHVSTLIANWDSDQS